MTSDRPATVVLADDHALVRDLMHARIDAEPDLVVVAATGTADAAVRAVQRYHPDVLVLDIEMPGVPSFDAARTSVAHSPDTRIVFLTAFDHDGYVEQALAIEGASFVTKAEPPDEIVDAVREAAAGRRHLSPAVRRRLVIDADGRSRLAATGTRLRTLTPRERDVLACLARGMCNKEIAEALHISVKTVDHHCTHLMAKLDIHDRVQLTRYSIREGIVTV